MLLRCAAVEKRAWVLHPTSGLKIPVLVKFLLHICPSIYIHCAASFGRDSRMGCVKVFIISAQRGPDLPAHLRSCATDVRSFLLRNGHQERAPAGLQVCEDVSSVLEKPPPSSRPNPEPLT